MRFFRRIGNERGLALPVALAVLFSVAGLATVAARAAIVANNQSFRDSNAKRAVQAANAGLQAAVYQTNLMQPAVNDCVLKNPSTGALSTGPITGGWCAAITEDLGDGGSYTVQVSAAGSGTSSVGIPVLRRTIVSTGIVNGARRRVTVPANASIGAPVFPSGYTVAARDSIDMKNNAEITGGLASNGTINLKNNAEICGNVTAGPGKKAVIGNNFTQCPGYNTTPAEEPMDLQPVDMSRATPNQNERLAPLNTAFKDTCSNCGKVNWNPGNRTLTVEKDGVLTLSGNTYLFCRLEVKSSGRIQISSRTSPLFIYIDSPQNCGNANGMGSMIWDGELVNLYSPPHALAILVAGSTTKATSVDLPTNDANSPMGIYAPNSTVVMKNDVQFTGAVVAKSLDIKNNAHFTWHSSIDGIATGSSIRFYQAGVYKECTNTPTTSAPDSGC